jgi:ribosomal 30S subunit maturation factor RimM
LTARDRGACLIDRSAQLLNLIDERFSPTLRHPEACIDQANVPSPSEDRFHVREVIDLAIRAAPADRVGEIERKIARNPVR